MTAGLMGTLLYGYKVDGIYVEDSARSQWIIANPSQIIPCLTTAMFMKIFLNVPSCVCVK